MGRILSAVLFVIYIIIGVVVGVWTPLLRASRRSEADRLGQSPPLLWPLVLLGVNLHLK
jgi:hypothetical protein